MEWLTLGNVAVALCVLYTVWKGLTGAKTKGASVLGRLVKPWAELPEVRATLEQLQATLAELLAQQKAAKGEEKKGG